LKCPFLEVFLEVLFLVFSWLLPFLGYFSWLLFLVILFLVK
jgi:hypothetical protein